ncbi:hypothetical protein [Halalkalibacter akibai]|uniref:Lia operon protein LiaI n=1 Tax=Halalkalibacter akibai (strain ATCC 43226 / DSM 21942 / CIP 109018 / JCM 9157 / 1139) TaxID=1236973 RepID=W4QU37_HALA3|nr:hypothetical protein [Halalkalibacter akibai]GAE35685.1 hypothetical protein JCM9157_2802 [Halalkalibacter akibai JCM 9157]
MKITGKVIGGILLMFIGANIVLGMLGIHIGGLLGLVIGGCLLYFGYSKYKEKGKWSFGSILLGLLGAIILLGGMGGLVGLAIGALLVYGGYQLINPKKENEEKDSSRSTSSVGSTYEMIDKEFTRLIKEGDKQNDRQN